MQKGKKIYETNCVTCHSSNGEGVPSIFPPLAKSDYLMSNPTRAIKQLHFGLSGKIVVNGKGYNGTMPASGLTPQQITDVVNYITNSWGNKNKEVIKLKDVKKILGK
ncbi:MAG: cytochrome c [Cytophagales bacterium]|nr:MAG: cytochrome c [Cytophagales bacterium]